MTPLLNKQEAATILGIGVRTLERLTARGTIPHVRPVRRVLYRPEDLERFAQAQTLPRPEWRR